MLFVEGVFPKLELFAFFLHNLILLQLLLVRLDILLLEVDVANAPSRQVATVNIIV